MRTRTYGQFCGPARAAEVLGQRWTLLILRDLLVEPRRYSDLLAGLPGIPTNLLATRLKELEHDGLVTREVRRGVDRSIVYAVTARGTELAPYSIPSPAGARPRCILPVKARPSPTPHSQPHCGPRPTATPHRSGDPWHTPNTRPTR